MTILAPPWGRTPDPRAMNFTVLVEGVMDIITMHLVFSPRHMCGRLLEEYGIFFLILFIWSHQWQPGGGTTISCTILISFIMEMLCTKNSNNVLVVLKQLKMLNC